MNCASFPAGIQLTPTPIKRVAVVHSGTAALINTHARLRAGQDHFLTKVGLLSPQRRRGCKVTLRWPSMEEGRGKKQKKKKTRKTERARSGWERKWGDEEKKKKKKEAIHAQGQTTSILACRVCLCARGGVRTWGEKVPFFRTGEYQPNSVR